MASCLQWLFDPIFRWLQDSIIPKNPAGLGFLPPVQCAYADDLAVAASSFRDLMTALAPAFRSLNHIDDFRYMQVICKREGVVVGDEAPLGGVAQVVSHGVKVIGAEVGVHGEEGKEKRRRIAGGSKRRSRATQRETLIMDGMWMKVKDSRTT